MNITPVKVSDITELNLGFDYFNPPQSEFVLKGYHKKDCNLIISWQTSAGKTVTAELIAEQQLKKNKKVIYACPLKSLAEEKIKRFKKLFPDKNIEIFTGDYDDFSKRKTKAKNADIAVLTTELLDSISRNKNLSGILLNQAGAVIVDEFHIIATERGPAVESALTRLPQHVSIILLSATAPNTQQIADWIYSLNKKETVILASSYRPVQIDWHIIPVYGKSYKLWFENAIINLKELIFKLVNSDNGQILIFVWIKQAGYIIEQELKKLKIPCYFHNASLSLEERTDFESAFEQKKIRVLISTTTLAWGRNTSARYVIIFGDKRGYSFVDGWDVIQMGGRAGRLGYTDKGDVYWFVSNYEFAENTINHLPEIKSKLTDPFYLSFHVTGEFPVFGKIEVKKIKDWFKKTLAYRQLSKSEVNFVLNSSFDVLINTTSAVEYFPDTKELRLTFIGRIARKYYLHPLEVHKWIVFFNNLKSSCSSENIPELLKNPFIFLAYIFAHSSAKNSNNGYLTKGERENLRHLKAYFSEFEKYSFLFFDEYHEYITYKSYEWYISNQNSLFAKNQKTTQYYKIREYFADIERIGNAVKEITAYFYERKDLVKIFDKMIVVLKYGCPVEVYELLQIKGIGAKRAVQLAKLKIFTPEQLKNAVRNEKILPEIRKILPETIIKEFFDEKEKKYNSKNQAGIEHYE